MGGKQKRAAKYKKWMESQNLLKQNSQGQATSGIGQRDGSGDHAPDYQPIPYHVQQEMLKHRAKRTRKCRSSNWVLRKLENASRSFDCWPTWPCTVFIGVVSTILIFVFLRSLTQIFISSDVASVDRSSLYNGLRMALPRPVYKFIRIVDYLFTSPVISTKGLSHIVYPPEDNYYS